MPCKYFTQPIFQTIIKSQFTQGQLKSLDWQKKILATSWTLANGPVTKAFLLLTSSTKLLLKMMKLNFKSSMLKLIFQIINSLAYCSLFALGCYFIYEGQVIQRYTLGRTNFAEFDEELVEFPTIVFFIDNADDNRTYKLGSDFKIFYIAEANYRVITPFRHSIF